MSHVTQEQAKRLKELGFPQSYGSGVWAKAFFHAGLTLWGKRDDGWYVLSNEETYAGPSAEELMEWLGTDEAFTVERYFSGWSIEFVVSETRYKQFANESLVEVVFQAACWVLEGKK